MVHPSSTQTTNEPDNYFYYPATSEGMHVTDNAFGAETLSISSNYDFSTPPGALMSVSSCDCSSAKDCASTVGSNTHSYVSIDDFVREKMLLNPGFGVASNMLQTTHSDNNELAVNANQRCNNLVSEPIYQNVPEAFSSLVHKKETGGMATSCAEGSSTELQTSSTRTPVSQTGEELLRSLDGGLHDKGLTCREGMNISAVIDKYSERAEQSDGSSVSDNTLQDVTSSNTKDILMTSSPINSKLATSSTPGDRQATPSDVDRSSSARSSPESDALPREFRLPPESNA